MISAERKRAANIIGTAAAVLILISFIPQVIHSHLNSNAGVSIAMYCIFLTGVVLWLIYGILIDETVIIVSNIIMVILVVLVLLLTLRNGRIRDGKTKYVSNDI